MSRIDGLNQARKRLQESDSRVTTGELKMYDIFFKNIIRKLAAYGSCLQY
jgi:hypothetical protein